MNPEMAAMLSEFVTLLLTAVITAAVPVITALAVKWLNAKAQELQAQIPAEALMYAEMVARVVVAAAEQSGLSGAIANESAAKKEWAMERGEELLRQYLALDLDLNKLGDDFYQAVLAGLDAAVEAEVASRNTVRLWNNGS